MEDMTIESKPTVTPSPGSLDMEFVIEKGELNGPHLLIQILPPDKTTAGGIIIPETHAKHRRIAHIRKIGRAVQEVEHGIFEVGDLVWFTMHAAQNIPELGDDIFHIHARDVIVRLPKEHAQNV